MKSMLSIRLLTATLFLAILASSLSYSQNHAQMDSMYAAMQRQVLREYPGALFPPIPYDQYDTVSEEYGEGRMDRLMGPVGDVAEECLFIFPTFETWDIYSAETKKDPMAQQYVTVTFYLLDQESGALMEGRASKILNRKKKKGADMPDEYKPDNPEESGVFSEPAAIDEYSCEKLRNCLSADNPIFEMATQYCAASTTEDDDAEDW